MPGKQIQIVRNPNWNAKTDYRPAYLDAVNIDEGNSDLTVASRRTLQGNATLCCDAGSPPAPVLKQALSRNKDQVIFVPSGGTRYIGINNTIKPFDNLNVRKAIIAGTDRSALRLTRRRLRLPLAQSSIQFLRLCVHDGLLLPFPVNGMNPPECHSVLNFGGAGRFKLGRPPPSEIGDAQ